MSGSQEPAPAANHYNDFVFRRMLDEVYLLLDFVSSRGGKSLEPLKSIQVPDAPEGTEGKLDEVLQRISMLRYPPHGSPSNIAKDAAFLLIVKDRLTQLAAPATGSTIAFTALVIGTAREPVTGAERAAGEKLGRRIASRYSLAAEAQPGLLRAARITRCNMYASIAGLILLTLLTVMLSGAVAYGRSLLEQLSQAERNYAAAEAITFEVDDQADLRRSKGTGNTAVAPGEGGPPPGGEGFVRYCDRVRLSPSQLPVDRFADARQSRVCPALWAADIDIQVAKYRLRQYVTHMEAFFSFFGLMPRPLVGIMGLPPRPRGGPRSDRPADAAVEAAYRNRCSHFSPPPASGTQDGKSAEANVLGCEDVFNRYNPDRTARDVIAALANYVLPFLFTLLGTGVSILRDAYARMRESTLGARDLPMSFGRLVLGMAAGAAIGLFYSPTSETGSAVALSLQGLAFAAGYGVDAVFRWFDQRIEAAFTPEPGSRGPAGGAPSAR